MRILSLLCIFVLSSVCNGQTQQQTNLRNQVDNTVSEITNVGTQLSVEEVTYLSLKGSFDDMMTDLANGMLVIVDQDKFTAALLEKALAVEVYVPLGVDDWVAGNVDSQFGNIDYQNGNGDWTIFQYEAAFLDYTAAMVDYNNSLDHYDDALEEYGNAIEAMTNAVGLLIEATDFNLGL